MATEPNPNKNPNPASVETDETETLFTAEEVERIVEGRLAKERAKASRPRQAQPADTTSSTIDALLKLKLAEALGSMSQPNAVRNERPVSDRGAPPASAVPLTEQSLVHMSDSDRVAVIKQKGLAWYRDTLRLQLKGMKISL